MKVATGLLLLPALLAAAAGHAISGRGEAFPAPAARAFSIDGRRFAVGCPSPDSFSLVERDLARRGIDAGAIPGGLRDAIGAATVEPLREEPGDADDIRLPGGFEAEHVLRLQSTTGPIEIAFGRVARAPENIVRQLRSAGWDCREADADGPLNTIARVTGRKEASIVLLDKTARRFLAVRRPPR